MTTRDRTALAMLALPVLGLYLPMASWVISAFTEQRAGDTAWSTGIGKLLLVSFGIALAGALLAGLLGATQALLLEGFPVRGRRWLSLLFLLPFLLPAAALTTAFHCMLADGPLAFLVQGFVGAVFLSGIQMAPVVMWGTTREIAAMPKAEWHAMRSQLSPGRAAWRVLIPRVRGTVLRLVVLCFAFLFPQLEIPGYTGMQPIGFRILSAFTSGSDLEGLVLVLVSVVVVVLAMALVLPALARSSRVPLLGRHRWPRERDRSGATEVLWLMAVLYVLPMLTLMGSVSAVGWGVHAAHLGGLAVELMRTLLVAAAVSLVGWRLAQRRGLAVWAWFALPLLLPGSLPALALASGVPAAWLRTIGDWPLALSLAQAVRFGGLALVFGCIGLRSIPHGELAAADFLAPGTRRWRILLPRCRGSLAVSTLFIALLMLGEVESANLLAPPGYTIPALELHNFLHFRYDENAWSLALILCMAGSIMALCVMPFTKSRS